MNDPIDDPHAYTMGVMEHLRELRKRLLYSAVVVTIGAIGAYYFSGEVFALLSAPYIEGFGNAPLIGTSPAEAWLLKVKVAFFCGAVITSPVLFYQFWAFIAPGLYERERRWVVPFVFVSSSLFLGGAAFCYYTVLPMALSFFRDEFLSIGVTPTIRIGEHVSMTIVTLLGFGVVFELPLLTFVLARAGIIDQHFLIRWYRQAILLIFIISAIVTPPDVLSQVLLALPLLGLYVVSIGIALVTARRTSATVTAALGSPELEVKGVPTARA
jgi:sec-independent protein translocase protein TatC